MTNKEKPEAWSEAWMKQYLTRGGFIFVLAFIAFGVVLVGAGIVEIIKGVLN